MTAGATAGEERSAGPCTAAEKVQWAFHLCVTVEMQMEWVFAQVVDGLPRERKCDLHVVQ